MHNSCVNKFTERIKELRTDKGLTQAQIEDELKLSRSMYSSWEQGRRQPNPDAILMLAKFFNVTAGQLLGSEEL